MFSKLRLICSLNQEAITVILFFNDAQSNTHYTEQYRFTFRIPQFHLNSSFCCFVPASLCTLSCSDLLAKLVVLHNLYSKTWPLTACDTS